MKPLKRIGLILLSVMIIVGAANFPAKTKQGVNYEVTTMRIPLYAKLCGFLYRDYQYKALARRIAGDLKSGREKVEALYNWTVENIRERPEGFPVVDDHIWSTVVRGYGVPEQAAAVFGILAGYMGYEAFWYFAEGNIVLSFVKVGEDWHIFDISNRKAFIDEIYLDFKTHRGLTYRQYADRIEDDVFYRRIRKVDRQRPFGRVACELKRIFDRIRGK